MNRNHVVISGGGSGLGLGIAVRYLRRGARVSVLDLRMQESVREKLNKAQAEGNGSWQFYEADVTNEEQLAATMQHVKQQHGEVSLAVNSAGIPLCKTIADMKPGEYSRVIQVNLIGSYNFAAAVLPCMAKDGQFALVASLAGITSNYGYSAYGSSKFGVIGLATTIRYEYEVQGLTVSCICPPEVETPLVEEERLHANKIAMELKKIAGTMNAEDACDQIVAGLDAGKWMIVPSAMGKVTAWTARYTPAVFHRFISVMIRRTRDRIHSHA